MHLEWTPFVFSITQTTMARIQEMEVRPLTINRFVCKQFFLH